MTLTVKELCCGYRKNDVLKGVSFSCHTGELICLLGENGTGKTTLFRCILGFMNNYSGEILIDETPCLHLSVPDLAKKIAYIPQAHAPAFNYSVFETVLMGTNPLTARFRTPGEKERKIVSGTLELLGISHLSERGYAEISGGERQLCLIARALAQQSKILIMDEPTAHLDYGNQLRIMEQVKQLAKKGYLILLSTHNPEHALSFGSKALILKNGKTELFGTPKDILTAEVIKDVYHLT